MAAQSSIELDKARHTALSQRLKATPKRQRDPVDVADFLRLDAKLKFARHKPVRRPKKDNER